MSIQGNERQTIFVAGYPKSGTTWLTRLLADALNCPSGGDRPSQDKVEPASEGWNRKGPFIVRKGHYKLVYGEAAVVPSAHRLCLEQIQDEKVIFLVRDPRDIAVSAAFYHDIPLDDVILGMINGSRYGLGPWAQYVHEWEGKADVAIRYEDLLRGGPSVLHLALQNILSDKPYRIPDIDALIVSVANQSFAVRQKQIQKHGDSLPMGKEQNLRLLRKGIAGDWKDHFNTKQFQFAMRHWEYQLKRMGYES